MRWFGQQIKEEEPSKNKQSNRNDERKHVQENGIPAKASFVPPVCSTPMVKNCRDIFTKKEDQENCIDETLEVNSESKKQIPAVPTFFSSVVVSPGEASSLSCSTRPSSGNMKRFLPPVNLDDSNAGGQADSPLRKKPHFDEKLRLVTPRSLNRDSLSKNNSSFLSIENNNENDKDASKWIQPNQPFKSVKSNSDSSNLNRRTLPGSPRIRLFSSESPKKSNTSNFSDSDYFSAPKVPRTAVESFNFRKKTGGAALNSSIMNISNELSSNCSFGSDGFQPVPLKLELSVEENEDNFSLNTKNSVATTIKSDPTSFDSDSLSGLENSENSSSASRNSPVLDDGKPVRFNIYESVSVTPDLIAMQSMSQSTSILNNLQKTKQAKLVSFHKSIHGKVLHTSTGWSSSYLTTNFSNLSELGSGNFGVTYKAVCENHGESAIKTVRAGNLAVVKDVFHHEVLGKHPNVVQFHRAWVECNTLHVQMEVCRFSCEGLHYFFENSTTTDPHWLLLSDCCKALLHVHSKSIVHLDVRPANILLGGDWNFKLCDFGCSAANAWEFGTRNVSGEYAGSEILGMRAVDLTNKADVFALGQCVIALASEEVFKKDGGLAKVVSEMKKGDHTERPNASEILKGEIMKSKDVALFRRDMQAAFEDSNKRSSGTPEKKQIRVKVPQTPLIKTFVTKPKAAFRPEPEHLFWYS